MHDEREAAIQDTWGEREIRRLLNGLRRPETLTNDSLARLLCETTGSETISHAIQKLIDATFDRSIPSGRRMAQLIRRSDIEGTLTQTAVAGDLGLSRRQYFRYRARAIALMAQNLRSLLGPAARGYASLAILARLTAESAPAVALKIYDLIDGVPDSESMIQRMRAGLDAGIPLSEAWICDVPSGAHAHAEALLAHSLILNGAPLQGVELLERLKSHPGPWVSAAYEKQLLFAEIAFVRQRHQAEVLANLAHRCREVESRETGGASNALLVEAEAVLRLGNIAHFDELVPYLHRIALANKDLRSVGRLTLLNADRALMAGDAARAEELATAAFLVLRNHHPDGAQCECTLARARLRLGKPWTMPERFLQRPETAWDRLACEVLQARFDVSDANLPDAFERASHVLERSRENEYAGLVAHAAATLGAIAGITGDDELEQRLYVEAWKVAVEGADRLCATDLFVFPGVRPRELGPLAIGTNLMDAIRERFETLAHDPSDVPAQAFESTLRALVDHSAGEPLREPLTIDAAALPAIARIGEELSLFLPAERRERWTSRWHTALRRMPRVTS